MYSIEILFLAIMPSDHWVVQWSISVKNIDVKSELNSASKGDPLIW